MGLPIGTPVAVGMIDAHAGGIGTVGVLNGAVNNMAYVFGTSSCTMTTTQEAVFVPGVWGPYYSAMVPGYWLSEGGQKRRRRGYRPAAELPSGGGGSARASESRRRPSAGLAGGSRSDASCFPF